MSDLQFSSDKETQALRQQLEVAFWEQHPPPLFSGFLKFITFGKIRRRRDAMLALAVMAVILFSLSLLIFWKGSGELPQDNPHLKTGFGL